MWKGSVAKLSSCLIVENDKGNVFILDNEKVDEKSTSRSSRQKARSTKKKSKTKSKDLSPFEIKSEIKDEPLFKHLDDEEEIADSSMLDLDQSGSGLVPKVEVIETHHSVFIETKTPDPPTFDGNWSDDEGKDDESFFAKMGEIAGPSKPRKRKKPAVKPEKPLDTGEIYECKFCDTQFATKRERESHMCKYLKCNLRNFICRFCNKEVNKKDFSEHIKDVEAHPKGFIEPPKDEADEIPVVKKTRKPRRRKIFQCDTCGKHLPDRRDLEKHFLTHSAEPTFMCATCGYKYFTQNGLKRHTCDKKKIKRTQKDYRNCRFCQTPFTGYDEKLAHKCPFQNPMEPLSVICRFCGKSVFKVRFNRHVTDLHSDKEWTCSVCSISLQTERGLKVHMEIHTGIKEFPCEHCSESFKKKLELVHHLRVHGIVQKTFHCEHCFREFASVYALKSHIAFSHNTMVKRCEICKAEFATRELVVQHIYVAHEASVCEFCDKRFKTPSSLKGHLKVHYRNAAEAQAPSTCEFCHKLFNTQSGLKIHMYHKHRVGKVEKNE